LLDGAETTLGIFGFDRTLYGQPGIQRMGQAPLAFDFDNLLKYQLPSSIHEIQAISSCL